MDTEEYDESYEIGFDTAFSIIAAGVNIVNFWRAPPPQKAIKIGILFALIGIIILTVLINVFQLTELIQVSLSDFANVIFFVIGIGIALMYCGTVMCIIYGGIPSIGERLVLSIIDLIIEWTTFILLLIRFMLLLQGEESLSSKINEVLLLIFIASCTIGALILDSKEKFIISFLGWILMVAGFIIAFGTPILLLGLTLAAIMLPY